MKLPAFVAILGIATALTGCGSTIPNRAASVSIIEPADGAVVSSPFKVKFGVSGMALSYAGDMRANTGHHHLLINKGSVQKGDSIGFLDYQETHFSAAQTETQLTLPPGTYKITLQFANGAHESYGATMSRSISVTVK